MKLITRLAVLAYLLLFFGFLLGPLISWRIQAHRAKRAPGCGETI